jgi:hypothetical protein
LNIQRCLGPDYACPLTCPLPRVPIWPDSTGELLLQEAKKRRSKAADFELLLSRTCGAGTATRDVETREMPGMRARWYERGWKRRRRVREAPFATFAVAVWPRRFRKATTGDAALSASD